MMRMKDKMPDATEAKISDEIRSIDKTRKKYCSYYTNTEFGVADYYDLCLSTSTLGIDTLRRFDLRPCTKVKNIITRKSIF